MSASSPVSSDQRIEKVSQCKPMYFLMHFLLSFTCRLNIHVRVEYKFFSLVFLFYHKPSVEIVINENKKNNCIFFATALSNPLI